MRKTAAFLAALLAVMVVNLAPPAGAEEPTAAERVVALKSYLVESQTVLSQYDWIETTTVSIDGVEKARRQQLCYYGADGTVQKKPMNQRRGLRDEGAETGKKEVAGFMQDALHLVHQYVPLNPNGLQAVAENGKLTFSVTDPAKQGRLTIRDFLVSGDRVDLDLDLTNNRPISLKINTYLNSEREPFTLAVTFGSLYGSAAFARETVLESKLKKLKVTVQNTEYLKIAP
jgi:hypothetical protein